jgi:pentatricopeptide repeat protein
MAEKALEVFQEIRQRGVEPNVITYNALISACKKGKKAEKVLEVFQEQRQRGLEPDAAISTSATGGDHQVPSPGASAFCIASGRLPDSQAWGPHVLSGQCIEVTTTLSVLGPPPSGIICICTLVLNFM